MIWCARDSAGLLLLTQCMPQPPSVRRGNPHDTDASPRARSRASIAPRVHRLLPMSPTKASGEDDRQAVQVMFFGARSPRHSHGPASGTRPARVPLAGA